MAKKSMKGETAHISLNDDTREAIDAIRLLLRAWGQNATVSSAARFAILRTSRDLTNPDM